MVCKCAILQLCLDIINTFELRIIFLVSPLVNERAQVLFNGDGIILEVLLAVLAMVPLAHFANYELKGLFSFLPALIIQFIPLFFRVLFAFSSSCF
jgi:hypothetical protein